MFNIRGKCAGLGSVPLLVKDELIRALAPLSEHGKKSKTAATDVFSPNVGQFPNVSTGTKRLEQTASHLGYQQRIV